MSKSSSRDRILGGLSDLSTWREVTGGWEYVSGLCRGGRGIS